MKTINSNEENTEKRELLFLKKLDSSKKIEKYKFGDFTELFSTEKDEFLSILIPNFVITKSKENHMRNSFSIPISEESKDKIERYLSKGVGAYNGCKVIKAYLNYKFPDCCYIKHNVIQFQNGLDSGSTYHSNETIIKV